VGRDTLSCRACETEHFLSVRRDGNLFDVRYHRYTLRYPLEYYDSGMEPPVVELRTDAASSGTEAQETFSGPIKIYARKSRFTQTEVRAIWQVTRGACHICRYTWRVEERGRRGWHIDHVIPHIGGGADTEQLQNFRVACAKCNLRKGRGYTKTQVQLGIRRLLIEQFQP